MKIQHWVGHALDCGYFVSIGAEFLNSVLEGIGRMLKSMMEETNCLLGPLDRAFHEHHTEKVTDD